MLIRDWMTTNVITVTADTPMITAGKLMKDHDIRRLPVVDNNGRVIGIVSVGDVQAASPSKATTLDMNELYHFLLEMKIKDIMTPDPITVGPLDTVEQAALLMLEKGLFPGGLPVVDADKKVVGIITDYDVFTVLLNITGMHEGGVQLAFRLPDKFGTLRSIFGVLWEHQASIISVLSSSGEGGEDERNVYVRIRPMTPAQEEALSKVLKERFNLLYWARDEVYLT
ncbi:MAG: CBS and ACT domain-containing protein [Deltaproteobacteria bacterium]|jgi:acetoin utilization protein AcuB|nr:CBS and ACT domain-containing protein [Deltaproteobacteria bacterium]